MPTNSLTYRAFVSSTFQDLREHRKHVIESLRKSGLDVEAMEEFSADSKTPRDFCAARMKYCNLCVLIVGLRRGLKPPGEDLSFTQIEYEEALKQRIDVLPFLLSESVANAGSWPQQFDERQTDDEIRNWRVMLRERHIVREFDERAQSINIDSAIARWVVDIESTRAARFRRNVKMLCAVFAMGVLALGFYFLHIYQTPSLRSHYLSRFLAYHDPAIFNSSPNGDYELARALDSYGTLRAETRLSDEVQGTQKSMDLVVNNAQYIRHEQRENFLDIIHRGGRVRILLWDYTDQHGNRASYDAFCRAIGQNPEETCEGTRNVHGEFLDWQEQIKSDRKRYPGKFEFRWNMKPLFYTSWVRDWGGPEAIGHLGVHFYRGQEYFPNFRVSMRDGSRTLRNMQTEFEKAWADAVEVDLK